MPRPKLKGHGPAWTDVLIADVRSRVKASLDQAEAGGENRLQVIAAMLEQSKGSDGREALLEQYTLAMSALVAHERGGGLAPSQVAELARLARGVLALQGVDPEHSRHAYLYADVHLVLSQIARKGGEHWSAMWQQQMALRHPANPRNPNGGGPELLATAIRALRLGQAKIALLAFQAAEHCLTEATQIEKARLGQIKTLRLRGELAASRALVVDTRKTVAIGDSARLELAWEEACLAATERGDLSQLIAMTASGEPHCMKSYVAEAFFWAAAAHRKTAMAGLPPLARWLKAALPQGTRSADPFQKVAVTFERLYDQTYPFESRLEWLGELLSKSSSLISIDKELLLWAAAARWLLRSGQALPCAVTLEEYQARCRGLSEGKTNDVFAIMTDVDATALHVAATEKIVKREPPPMDEAQ